MFCAPGHVFMFCAPGLVFGGSESVRSCFYVLPSPTCLRRFRRRRVPFSCFTLLDTLSAVRRASGPIFMFCAPRLVFSGNEGAGSHFHVSAPGDVSRGTEGVGSCFQVLRSRTLFLRYRGHWVPFSGFARPNSFSAKSRVSAPVFMFYAPGLVFGIIEGVGSRFHVLRAQTHFRIY
jgi:hypothetical protein